MQNHEDSNMPDDRVHDEIPEGKERPWILLYTLVVIALFLQIILFTWFTLHFK